MTFALFALLLGILIGYLLKAGAERLRTETKQDGLPSTVSEVPEEEHPVPDLYSLAAQAEPYFDQSAHPRDLLASGDFQRGVDFLTTQPYRDEDLLGYATGANALVACMALEALNRRRGAGSPLASLIEVLRRLNAWTLFFALRALGSEKQGVVGSVIAQAQEWWPENDLVLQTLRAFAEERINGGERPTFGDRLETLSAETTAAVEKLLAALNLPAMDLLINELRSWQQTRVDTTALKDVGRIWGDQNREVILEHAALRQHLCALEDALLTDPPRSVLLVGPTGVGKTVLVRLLARGLQKDGWTVFEAGASDILAGQIYVGQLEKRVQELARNLDAKPKVLWVIPRFHELLFAGRHRYSQTSVLDMILPFVEAGRLVVVGETQPEAHEKLHQAKPRVRTALETIRIEPLEDRETRALARSWADIRRHDGAPILRDETLREAMQLARQYLADKAPPGNLLDFLELTFGRLAIEGGIAEPISLDDLLVTLSRLTGLPASILDDRQALDVRSLEGLFHRRVLGQPDAVACLVERVAMVKAGLTDPSRPLGVFLFVGPTGTGKTEIAKTLAEFLFGSPDRMIRLDMSEFKTPESLGRLLGESEESTESVALVNSIRKQPFAVLLLDEFEKAHPMVWDLFLQVFDDGRLTDRRGNTADFRHCIIILTSNLGATSPRGVGLGFGADAKRFSSETVIRSVSQTFRPEFVNRLDRVVVFRPLSRSVMRDILHKELVEVLQRRGLRTREWAVEWDDSAIEFLLNRGFAADLGARPLKRAIEQYLLSPLAITIVTHQFPAGDQFLFVCSDGQELKVEFIDPDGPEEQAGRPASPPSERGLDLRSLLLEARGTRAEIDALKAEYQGLATRLTNETWVEHKRAALARMDDPDFWASSERMAVLADIEYLDRMDAGFKTAGSLLQRLEGRGSGQRNHFPRDLVRRLAQQIYLLQSAHACFEEGKPRDAFLAVEAHPDPQVPVETTEGFARRLVRMYRRWAEKRGMQCELLKEDLRDGYYHCLLAIAGFGSFPLLRPENGLHVLELLKDRGSSRRGRVRVRVAPQEIASPGEGTVLEQAIAAFADEAETQLAVVRHYREEPSPLVRDGVRRWRTGRLDRVLDGDFDLFT